MALSRKRPWRRCGVAPRAQEYPGSSPRSCQLGFEALEERRLLALMVPPYNSLPGAFLSLYIDFDGAPAFDWDGGDGILRRAHGFGDNNAPIPAFSIDNTLDAFSQNELDAIEQIWSDVAEKYSPFNINVTTVVPPNFNDFQAIQMIVGGSNLDWIFETDLAGVASAGGFINSTSNQGFAFSKDLIDAGSVTLSTEDREELSETIAHEAGHVFDLNHQSDVDANNDVRVEYSNGTATKVPIMGNAGAPINLDKHGTWFNGPSSYQTIDGLVYGGTQDDLDHLYNLLGQRPDDFGPGSSWTTNDNQGHFTARGIIGNLVDTDSFRFTAIGSSAYFAMGNEDPLTLWSHPVAMLTPRMELRSWPNNTPINPAWTIPDADGFSMFFENLVIGQEYIAVASSDFTYGSLGHYYIYGSNTSEFAYVHEGVLYINGVENANDDIQLDVSFDPNFLYVDNVVNGNVVSLLVPFNSFGSIVINTRSGNDSVRYRSPIGIYPTNLDMGVGSDTLEVRGTDFVNFFDVSAGRINFDFTVVNFNSTVENLKCLGLGGDDPFSVSSSGATKVSMYGGNGNDTLNVATAGINSTGARIMFFGEANADTLYLNDNLNTAGRSFTVGLGRVEVINAGQVRDFEFDSTTETVRVAGGSGADTFDVQGDLAGQTMRVDGNNGADTVIIGSSPSAVVANGNDGNDVFIVGDGNVGTANYAATMTGGAGNDTLVLDDSLYAGAANWAITGANLQRNIPGQAQAFSYAGFEGVGINTGAGGGSANNITTFGAIPVSVTVTGGPGADNFFINNFANEAAGGPIGPEQLQSMFNGGGGFNQLIVDDAARGILTYNMYPTRLEINEVLADDGEFSYLNISAMSIAASDFLTTLNVYGTPAHIAPGNQTTVVLRGGNDVANVYPHDAAGNLTVTTNIGIIGDAGTDTLNIQDVASAGAINYSFSNPFGAGTQNIFGMGTGGLGTATIENHIINAGTGADAFAVNEFKSGVGLTINAGGGDDTLNFGNNNLPLNITNLASFNFDGQGGFDRFNLNNATDIGNWTYTRNNGSINAVRSGYGGVTLAENATEEMTVNAGPAADSFMAPTTRPGTHTIFNGAGGFDFLRAGTTAGLTSLVSGAITFDAGTPNAIHGGSIAVSAAMQSDAKTVHLNASTLGAVPGDNLFGGGSLEFFNIIALDVTLGTGADAVYAQPLALATVQFGGNNPTTVPGDVLNISLAAAQNYVVNGTPTSGNLTSFNLMTLTYNGFETRNILSSGNFDGDGDVDGGDFLSWQRGRGKGPAMRPDGDADLDNDVDGDDLALWKAQFGNPALVVAAAPAASAGLVADDSQLRLSPQAIDAAMAWQLAAEAPASRPLFRPRWLRAR